MTFEPFLSTDRPAIEITNVQAIDATSVSVTWTLPYDQEVPFDTCKMEYRLEPDGSEFQSAGNPDPEALQYLITGLNPNTNYVIRLTCTSRVGDIPNIVGPVQTKEDRKYFANYKVLHTTYKK